MNREYVYIEIREEEIRFLRVSKSIWRRNREIYFCSRPLKKELPCPGGCPDTSELLETLKEFRREHYGEKIVDAYLLIPFHNGLIREYKLPWLDRKNRDTAVKYFLEQEIPAPEGELVYNYEETEEKEGEYLKITVTAARKDIILGYSACLRQAGYRLQGVQYSSAVQGEALGFEDTARVLVIQGIKGEKVQLSLYRGKVPEIIRVVELPAESSRYLLSLGLKDYTLPTDFILADGSPKAEKIACLLCQEGLAKFKLPEIPVLQEKDISPGLAGQGFKIFALWGCRQKKEKGFKTDLYSPFLFALKTKLAVLFAGIFLLTLVFFSMFFWFPLKKDLALSIENVRTMQADLERLQSGNTERIWSDWLRLEELSGSDLRQLQKVCEYTDDINVTRLNYRQGKLLIWAECAGNALITELIGKLTDDDWREPVLVDFKYYRESTSFCLSVQRPKGEFSD
jgi:hypothetical protein